MVQGRQTQCALANKPWWTARNGSARPPPVLNEEPRPGSKFWNVSGVDVSLSLFRGLEVNMESLRSIAAGGIAFATPADPTGQQVKDGMSFSLYSKAAKEWLEWAPNIPLRAVKQSPQKDIKRKPVRSSAVSATP